MKRIYAGLAIATIFAVTHNIHPGNASDCINYWTNPSTGQQECLGQQLNTTQPSSAASPSPNSTLPKTTASPSTIAPEASDFVKRLSNRETRMEGFLTAFERINPHRPKGLVDDLKECEPYSSSFSATLGYPANAGISRSVVGDGDGNCIATVGIKPLSRESNEQVAIRCQFSPTSVSDLTRELNKAKLRISDNNQPVQFSKIDNEQIRSIFDQECYEIPEFTTDIPGL